MYARGMEGRSVAIAAVVSMVVGAMASVGLAWGLAWADRGQSAWIERTFTGGAVERNGVWFGYRGSSAWGRERFKAMELDWTASPSQPEPSSTAPPLPGWAEARRGEAVNSFGYGWPVPCAAAREVGSSFPRLLEGWWQIHRLPSGFVHRRVPVRLLGGGVVVNTLTLAAPVFIAMVGAGWVVQLSRRKRGQCEQCGYERGGIRGVCPECGSEPSRGGQ